VVQVDGFAQYAVGITAAQACHPFGDGLHPFHPQLVVPDLLFDPVEAMAFEVFDVGNLVELSAFFRSLNVRDCCSSVSRCVP